MKTKFFPLMVMAAAMIFSLSSCKDDNYEEATLDVTPSEVTFTTDGGAQRVVVTTNRSKWVATSPQEGDWITLTTSGDQLTVTATANTGAARKGYILVNAGDAATKVTFSQAAGSGGATSEFSVTPENLALQTDGGSARFDVIGTTDFTVTTSADWITVTKLDGASFFNIVASPYTETGTREAKLNIQSGAVIKEVTITQQGKLGLILPYLATEMKLLDILNFENARGSRLIQTPDGFFNPYNYIVITASDRITQITYNVRNVATAYNSAVAFSPEKTLGASAEFKEFMTQNNFTLESENAEQTTFTYSNSEYPYAATVTCGEEAGGTAVTLNFSPKQPQDYPTFTELPMAGKDDWLSNVDAKIHGKPYDPDIINYEAEQNSTPGDVVKTATNWYAPFNTNLTDRLNPFFRGYWIELTAGDHYGEVKGMREAYNDISVVFFVVNDIYYLTKEFTKLLADSGYQYQGTSGAYRFYKKDNLQLAFAAGKWDDNIVSAIDFQKICTGAPSSGGSMFKIVTVTKEDGTKFYELQLNEKTANSFRLLLK